MSRFSELVKGGQCGYCGRPQDRENKTICTQCNEKKKQEYVKNKENHKCAICKRPHRGQGVECVTCKSEKKKELKRKSTTKLCVRPYCEQPSTHGVLCDYHYQRRVASLDKRLKQGYCLGCGQIRLKDSRYCWMCWLKQFASKTDATIEQLNNLWEQQQGLCIYSGRKLIPGVNAQLDHIIATKNGGSNSLNNLQWVDKNVNYAKRALTEESFLTMIKDIYKCRLE